MDGPALIQAHAWLVKGNVQSIGIDISQLIMLMGLFWHFKITSLASLSLQED